MTRRRIVPTPHDVTTTEKLIRQELPAAVDEFLAHLPDQFRRRRRWPRRVAVLAGVVGLGAVVAAVARVPSLGPEPLRNNKG